MTRIILAAAVSAGAMFAQAPANRSEQEMCGMMKAHETAVDLAERLTLSFAAIEAAKDPMDRQQKLAEHAAILKQLRETLKPEAKNAAMADKMKAMHEHMNHGKDAANHEEPKDEVIEHQKQHSHE